MKSNLPNLAALVSACHEKTVIDATNIRAEIVERKAVDEVFAAVLALYGSIKATELQCPRLVVALIPNLERAIEAYSRVIETVNEEICEDDQ